MTSMPGDGIRWETLRYGKLVLAPGGPILPGCEHAVTGRSMGFPDTLLPYAHPTFLSVGDRDPALWAHCPWARTGGIVTGVSAGADPWLMIARQRERPEQGEHGSGRRYTEMLVAAIAARHYDPRLLPTLVAQLVAEPPVQPSSHIDAIELAAPGDLVLPAGWLDAIRLPLTLLLSGYPLAIQDWEQTPEDAVPMLVHALVCLPRTLAWRVPLGAGLISMSGREALATGMSARTDVRTVEGVLRHDVPLDLTVGEAYVDSLQEIAGHCETSNGVMRAIASLLPSFREWDALPVEMEWRDAARTIAHAVAARRAVSAFMRNVVKSVARIDLSPIAEHPYGALPSLVALCRGQQAGPVTRLLESLPDTWCEAARQIVDDGSAPEADYFRAICMRHGIVRVDDPSALTLVAHLEVDPTVEEAVVARLVAAVNEATSGAEWAELAGFDPLRRARWLAEWRHAAEAQLAALALHEVALASPGAQAHPAPDPAATTRTTPVHARAGAGLLRAIGDLPLGRAVHRIVAGESIAAEPWYRLLAACRSAPLSVLRLLEDSAPDMRSALLVADAAEQRGAVTQLAARLTDEAAAQAMRKSLLRSTPTGEPIGPVTLSVLIRGGASVPPSWRQAAADAMGDPWAAVFLAAERPTDHRGILHREAGWYLQHLSTIDAAAVERVIQQFVRFGPDAQRDALMLLRAWLDGAHASSGPVRPYASLLRILAHGGTPRGEPWLKDGARSSAVEIMFVVARRLDLPRARAWEAVTHVRVLEIMVQLAPTGSPPPVLSAAAMLALLRAIAADTGDANYWRAQLERHAWHTLPGWRWVARHATDADHEELSVLARLERKELASLLLQGHALPVSVVADVRVEDLRQALKSRVQRSPNALVDVAALRHCLQVLPVDERPALARLVMQQAVLRAKRERCSPGEIRRIVRQPKLSRVARVGQFVLRTFGSAPSEGLTLLREVLMLGLVSDAEVERAVAGTVDITEE